MINRRKFVRGLMAFLLCGILAFALCGASCKTGPADPGGETAAQKKAAALVQAKRAERIFADLVPLIAKNNPALQTKLSHLSEEANSLTADIEADDATALVPLLADLLPQVNALVLEHAGDSLAVQLLLAGLDEALNYFADRFASTVASMPAPSRAAVKTSPEAAAIIKFRDGSHLRFRDKASGKFVSADYAADNPTTVYVEKTNPVR